MGNHNGFASFDDASQQWGEDCGQYAFFELLNRLHTYRGQAVTVRIEDTSQMQQLYEAKMQPLYDILNQMTDPAMFSSLKSKLLGQIKISVRISNNVGMNAAVARKIIEYCERLDLAVDLVQPSSGSYTKLKPEEFDLILPVNQEQYPELYRQVHLVSYSHLRDAMSLLAGKVTDKPMAVPLLPGVTKVPQNERERRILQAMYRGTINAQLKRNKAKRSHR